MQSGCRGLGLGICRIGVGTVTGLVMMNGLLKSDFGWILHLVSSLAIPRRVGS